MGGVGTVEPTAKALLDDRAAKSPKPPGTDGKSSRERWPLVPVADALAMGKVVQASARAAGAPLTDAVPPAGGEAVHAAAKAATARIPARRRRLLHGFICPMLLMPLRRARGANVAPLVHPALVRDEGTAERRRRRAMTVHHTCPSCGHRSEREELRRSVYIGQHDR